MPNCDTTLRGGVFVTNLHVIFYYRPVARCDMPYMWAYFLLLGIFFLFSSVTSDIYMEIVIQNRPSLKYDVKC